MARVGGVIVRVGGQRQFIASDAVARVVARPDADRIPGSAIGMALIAGRVVAVLEVGAGNDAILCEHDGETLAVSGVEAERSGFFDRTEGGVLVDEAEVTSFDLAARVEAAQSSRSRGGP